MATSKLQEQTKKRIRLLLAGKRVVENYRPDWLKNPDTGYPLELDFWLPEIDTGIEVQGNQHFEFTPLFHGTVENFRAQLQRDALKKAMCQKRGITLYEICSPDDIDTMVESIMRGNNGVSKWLYERNHAIKALCYMAAQLVRLPKNPKTRRAALVLADKRDSLLTGMINLAQQNKIPLNAIEPDFTIKKQEMTFPGCRYVYIWLYASNGDILDGRQAALIYIKGDIAHVQWYKKIGGKPELTKMDFDTKTGWQTCPAESDGPKWQLELETMPDDAKRIPVVAEGQRVMWHGSDPDHKHDFDMPVEAMVTEVSTKDALLQIETKSNTQYIRWVPVQELEIIKN